MEGIVDRSGFGEVSVIGAIDMVHVAQVEVTATIDHVGFRGGGGHGIY